MHAQRAVRVEFTDEQADAGQDVPRNIRGVLVARSVRDPHRVTLDQVNEGYDAMRAGENIRGVIVFD